LWNSFRHKLQTARQLSPGDWIGLGEAWWALLSFRVALRWVKFDRLEALTRFAAKKKVVPPEALPWAWRRQKLISMAARWHRLSMTCLPRALALRWMASRHGIPAQLRIGIHKSAAGVLAHAWVEIQNEKIGEPEDIEERFEKLLPAEQ
jgi:hypothetical protein